MQTAPESKYVIEARPREGSGKGAARRSRRAGRIPALIAQSGTTSLCEVDRVAIDEIFRLANNRNVFITVTSGGVSRPCLINEVQRHPVTRAVEHLDFIDVSQTAEVEVAVAVATVGRAAGTRAGGTLRVLSRKVNVRCAPSAIPSVLEVDVTPLEIGAFIKASDLVPPAGVTVSFRRDFNVVTVEGKRGAVAAAAAPAADAAAPAKAAPKAKPAAKK